MIFRRIAARSSDRGMKTQMLATIPIAFRTEVRCRIPENTKLKHMAVAAWWPVDYMYKTIIFQKSRDTKKTFKIVFHKKILFLKNLF